MAVTGYRRIAVAGQRACLVIAACLAMLAAVGPAPAQQPQRPAQSKAPPADEQAIRSAAQKYAATYNSGNAKALAALWTVDGDYTDEFGRAFVGRDAIEQLFAATFAAGPGATLEIKTESIRFLSPDVAIETGIARATPAHGNPTSVRYSAVQVKRDGQWLLASVRDLPRTVDSNHEYLHGLQWLVGSWEAASGNERLAIEVEWTENRNFLLRTYTVEKDGKTTRSGRQIIGWDPRAAAIVSWHFDSDGGFGQDHWHKQGSKWFIQTEGVLRDGGQASATNVLTPVDANTCTWQSLDRMVDGDVLPDTEPMQLKRVAAP